MGGEPGRLQRASRLLRLLLEEQDRTAGWDGCASASPGKVLGLGLALGGQVLKLEAKGRNSRQRIKAGCQPMRGRKGAASRIYFTEEPRVAASRSETFCFRVDSALERFGNGWGGDQRVQSCFLTDFSNTAAHFYFVAASSDSQGLFLFLAGGVLVCVCVYYIMPNKCSTA